MRTGIRVTRENLQMLASQEGISAVQMYDEMINAQLAFRREQNKRWSYEFFGKDEQWYDETMEKIQEIRELLPEDMNPIEATIKKYGWITKNGKKNLSMPMMFDEAYTEYAHAVAVEYALTNPNSYLRAMNWD